MLGQSRNLMMKIKLRLNIEMLDIKGFFKRDGGHSVYYDICFYPKLRSFCNWKHQKACGLSCSVLCI